MNNELIKSSTAEYLTFIAANGKNDESIEIRYEDENIWLTQKMMAYLYDVSVPAINQHIKNRFSDNELEPTLTIKKYLIVKNEGSKGWVMDSERLKNDGTVITKKYFEELLNQIREIRLSERKYGPYSLV